MDDSPGQGKRAVLTHFSFCKMLVLMLVTVALADQQTMFLCSKADCAGCEAEMLAFFVYRPDGSFADHTLSGQLSANPFTDLTFAQQGAVLSVVALNGAAEAGRVPCGFGLCCATPTLQVSAELLPIGAVLFIGTVFQGNETANETTTEPPATNETTTEPPATNATETSTTTAPATNATAPPTTAPAETNATTAPQTTVPATTTGAAAGNTTAAAGTTPLATTTAPETTTTPQQPPAGGLTSGQVAGIVIGVLLGVTGVVVLVIIVLRRRRKSYAKL